MTKEIKFRYWNPFVNFMVNNPEMPYKEGWTIEQLFEDRGWIWMQYTGLKDKHGREIYEGDMVEKENHRNGNSYRERYKVVYDYDGYVLEFLSRDGVSLEDLGEKSYIMAFGSPKTNDPLCLRKEEVIGNIYKNPELLENDKQK